MFNGKSILITGGTGSFGKKYTEICKTAGLCAVYRRKGHGNDTQKGN